MNIDQFNAAAGRTKLQDRSLEAAKLVLVKGHGHDFAGRQVGVRREQVRTWCYRILREHRGIVGCPPGWNCITVCVPPDVEEKINKLERIAFRELEKNNDKTRV